MLRPTFSKTPNTLLKLDHHPLNLGEGNPTLDGEARGILELGINTLIRFPLLKANDATVAGGVGMEKCPSTPWSKPNWWANL